MNWASFQPPSPNFLSDVRFDANDTPHGPAQAVRRSLIRKLPQKVTWILSAHERFYYSAPTPKTAALLDVILDHYRRPVNQ